MYCNVPPPLICEQMPRQFPNPSIKASRKSSRSIPSKADEYDTGRFQCSPVSNIQNGELVMAIIFEIKKYDVAYYAGGKNVAAYPYRAIIGLRDENDALIGAAYFHHSTTTM